MKKNHRSLITPGAILLCGLFVCAAAQAEEGYYLQIGAGGVFAKDTTIEGGTIDNDIEFNWGWGAAGSFGYKYDNGIRTELEAAFRHTDIDSISFETQEHGDVKMSTLMANMLVDIDILDSPRLMPYIGGGAGLAYLSFNDVSPLGVTTNYSVDESDIVPALQAIVGMSYDLSPGTALYANYHYLSALSPDYTTSNQASVKTSYDNSTLFLGLKFALGETHAQLEDATEESALPKPLSPISRTYLVFFDWNRYDLSGEAQAILEDAVRDAKSGNAVAIEVRGHADRSGSGDYNMRLSLKRAEAVSEYISALGIDSDSITTKAYGETSPLVATADGVREPQNRRAELVYVIDTRK